MSETAAEKTEPATPKRRSDARERGEVAQSRDVSSVAVLATAFLLVVTGLGPALGAQVIEQARALWGGMVIHPTSLGDFHAILIDQALGVGRASAPLALCVVLAAIAAPLLQTGPVLSTKAFEIKPSRMDPIQGFKRIVSVDRLVDLCKSILKLILIIAIGWWVVAPSMGGVMALGSASVSEAVLTAESLARRMMLPMLPMLALLALIDLAWVRHRHEKKLRMSRQEVRDELIQRDGNPHVRGRLRAAARELSRHRLVAEVARADVVVRNPTHFAVALAYRRSEMAAPTVVAMGRNRAAQRILEIARSAEVPIVENPPLARLLYRTGRLGREVPENLYQAVAEVLGHVYQLDRRRGRSWGVS